MFQISRRLSVQVSSFRPRRKWDGPWGAEAEYKWNRIYYLAAGIPIAIFYKWFTRGHFTYWHSNEIPVKDWFNQF
eukprot:TRINITY_DN964_c0_g1_i1.p3 TRINITY_DN964_c0_g1~~TRINITY_DN964_c0_g1_i1.p3  ORF type:complete len:75 (+),score=11.44 TRINITY_DN964_c0_g1_i1:61-285(+)